MQIRFLATAGLYFMLAASACAEEKFLLRPAWEPGKIYTQENVTDINMSIPALGAGGQKTLLTQTMVITVSKDSVADRKLAEVKLATIKGTIGMMGQNMAYDSTDPAKSSPILQQTFGAMAGKTFTVVYDKDDKFVETRNLEDLAPTPLGQGKGMSGQQLSEAFRKAQELGLPEKPVAVGETWTFEETLNMPPVGGIVIKASSKFESIVTQDGHRQAKLIVDGKFETPAGTDAKQLVEFAEGSQFSGTVYFDLDRKVISSSEILSDLKLKFAGNEAGVTQSVKNQLISIKDAK